MSLAPLMNFFFAFFFIYMHLTVARGRHIINFRSPNLFPEGIAWDPTSQHFVVGSLHERSVKAVSDTGTVQTLISDTNLPPDVTILGLAVDTANSRLLAVIHAVAPRPPFNALGSYDLHTRQRLFLAHLTDPTTSTRQIANDVTVDHAGNAYVTNSIGNFIWKVTLDGEPSILSRESVLTSQYIYPDTPYAAFGLNGIAYVSEGYLLVGQCNTGKLFRVDAVNGTAWVVKIEKDLMGGNDGIAVRNDGAVVVVSQTTAWLLKSKDGWGEAQIYDEIALDEERYPTTVALREDDRAYVVYGKLNKGMSGNEDIEEFSIEEIDWSRVNSEGTVWVYALVGFALAYFLFWRFQMSRLVKNMNKKTT